MGVHWLTILKTSGRRQMLSSSKVIRTLSLSSVPLSVDKVDAWLRHHPLRSPKVFPEFPSEVVLIGLTWVTCLSLRENLYSRGDGTYWLAKPESCIQSLIIACGLISSRPYGLRAKVLTLEERVDRAGRKNKSSLSFCQPLFSIPLPLQTAAGYGFCSCGDCCGCWRITTLKNPFGCVLLGEGREFPRSL